MAVVLAAEAVELIQHLERILGVEAEEDDQVYGLGSVPCLAKRISDLKGEVFATIEINFTGLTKHVYRLAVFVQWGHRPTSGTALGALNHAKHATEVAGLAMACLTLTEDCVLSKEKAEKIWSDLEHQRRYGPDQ